MPTPTSPSSPVRKARLPPNDVNDWLLPDPASMEMDATVGPIRTRRWAAALLAITSAMRTVDRVRMEKLLPHRARECRDSGHFMRSPTTRPAAFMRMSHAQQVAIESGLAFTYQTLLPNMARQIGTHSTVANSIPASGPPPRTHSAPRNCP